jgi:hypothetical protein
VSKNKSLWQRFRSWLSAPELRVEKPLTFQQQVARAMAGPGNPENIEVDWSTAPSDAIEWRFDERNQRGYWINGKHRIEEYGIVYDAYDAPSFGATRKTAIKIAPADAAARDAVQLQATTPTVSSSRPSRRL